MKRVIRERSSGKKPEKPRKAKPARDHVPTIAELREGLRAR